MHVSARRHETRFLMSRPQPLGVLPTLWFWREVRAERPAIGMLTGLFMGVFAVLVAELILVAGGNLPVAFIAALVLPLIGLGIVERGLRQLVLHRRRAVARGSLPRGSEPLPVPKNE